MRLNLGGEDVTVLALPADGNWAEAAQRVVRTIAPPEPHLPDSAVAAAGWQLYLPAGDPTSRTDRVTVRGVTYTVHGQPDVWADTCVVVRVITGARLARITLRGPATATWSDETETTTSGAPAAYASNVPAGIQAQMNRSENDAVSAEESLGEQPYVVTIDQDLAVSEGDEVKVTECAEDLSLVGRTLRVEQVLRGTERFERQLLCRLIDLPPTD